MSAGPMPPPLLQIVELEPDAADVGAVIISREILVAFAVPAALVAPSVLPMISLLMLVAHSSGLSL